MMVTIAGITTAATAVSALRNSQQWKAYHRAEISRAKMTNGVFTTLVLGAASVAAWVMHGLF